MSTKYKATDSSSAYFITITTVGSEPIIYTCECCGKKIKTYVFDDGTVMSPQEIVEKSKESYGKAMCMDCVFEQNVETESEEESIVEEEENTEE